MYSIFVSSTSSDLEHFRARARDLLLTFNFRPLEMEYFPAEANTTSAALDRYLAIADAVILIAGARYGSRTEDGRSYVEWEFDHAMQRGMPIACLVLDTPEREAIQDIDAEERRLQESFINKMKGRLKVAEFTSSTFDRVLGGAASLLPSQLGREAGLVQRAAYNKIADLALRQQRELSGRESSLRFMGGAALINVQIASNARMMNVADESRRDRAVLEKLLDLLYEDLASLPVTTRIIDQLFRRQVDRLHGFAEQEGFAPQSFGELEACLDELFGGSLKTLRATSIHSSNGALINYKGYWGDDEFGRFFRQKNDDFLRRRSDSTVLRVFVCDSIANSVGEEWFVQTVLQQLSLGASVKVVELDTRRATDYEDFGLYEHADPTRGASSYLLLAPRDRNIQQSDLVTTISADPSVASAYERKFTQLWEQSPAALSLLDPALLDEADRQESTSQEVGTIRQLFHGQVILRKMERLDTREKLMPSSGRSVRKYQVEYASAVSDHIKLRYPGVRRLVYLGDTHKNDGGVIRNLQSLGWSISGFICEPQLRLSRLLFNDVVYTDRWTDLVGFANLIADRVNSDTLALFDIDQTLWAPKGVHEGPLARSRVRAISRLLEEYIDDPESEMCTRAVERVDPLYQELSRHEYLPLTLDNEDFKAILCVCLALNVIFDQGRLEQADREGGAAFFAELSRLDVRAFVNLVRSTYLPVYLSHTGDSEGPITRFLMDALGMMQTFQYPYYGETNGILVGKLTDHLRDVFRETVGTATIQFPAFRAKELEEALSHVGAENHLDERLVLNRPAWDLAQWLVGRGCQLLALSDRPDESTVSPTGESLIDVEMTIFGKGIRGFLPG